MALGFGPAPGWRCSPPTASTPGARALRRIVAAITALHPLGSLHDQLFQIEDSETEILVVDAATFRDAAASLPPRRPA